ncbi:ATP-binding protein [Chitinilyticum litopenaei]|uniref:ATP-binding protein n=1 Tax=Chitinilyticum litopenaei TaxID=1121276 RepID=UPI0003F9B510|nr:ATP-binding protein [Chitinilyticum litopenaei]
MSIGQRIALLVVLAFLAIATLGGVAWYQFRLNAADVRIVTEGVVPSALASADLVARLKDVQLVTQTLVYAPDENETLQARNRLAAQQERLRESLELQLAGANSQTQQGLAAQAKETLGNYFHAIDETVQLKLAGQQEVAIAALFASVAQYQGELEQIIDTLRVEKNRTKDSAIAALKASMSKTLTIILLVTALAISLLALFGAVLYRQITHPVRDMQQMMSDIAGSQDFSRRVPVRRDDEIGRSIRAFNVMIGKIEESSALLRQKTNDIEAMLLNMPQGVLTVEPDKRVHPEYSAYLATILETEHIAGRNFIELVFAGSNLGADELAQIEAMADSCIGEDQMNFDFNAHLLVDEIQKTMPGGRVKILELNWSPIGDGAGNTARLMLCVRDVTELRKLAAEASEQRQELEMIGQILAVNQDKFHEFIVSAIKFIDESEILIRSHPLPDAGALVELFRNMHTIKGNARTYGLTRLTSIVHAAEQTYEELRKSRPGLVWDQQQLLGELAAVRAAVENYARINEVLLGRKGPGRQGSVERYLLVDKNQIRATLQQLESVNPNSLHELVAARDAVRHTLRLLGTESMEEILGSVIEGLPALAAELNKDAPQLKIRDNGYVLHAQAGGMLRNVFMHLIRNAVDHGIEPAAERLACGKRSAGEIRLDVEVSDEQLRLTLGDDGRGLALVRIREIAVRKGLIAPDARLDDAELAQLIFCPGFSTASKITEVSGRGVGMDAVQEFVQREGGHIRIVFTDQSEGAAFRPFAMQITLPAMLAEQLEGLALAPAMLAGDAPPPAPAVPLPVPGQAVPDRAPQAPIESSSEQGFKA